jgi:hypothetical protein
VLPFSNEGSAAAVPIEYGVKGYATALSKFHPFICYQRERVVAHEIVHLNEIVEEALIPEYDVLVSQPASYGRRPYCAQRTRRKLTIREYLHVTQSHSPFAAKTRTRVSLSRVQFDRTKNAISPCLF